MATNCRSDGRTSAVGQPVPPATVGGGGTDTHTKYVSVRPTTAGIVSSTTVGQVNLSDRADTIWPGMPAYLRAEPGRCLCGSKDFDGVPVHDGLSVRQDCARCKRFVGFGIWYGRTTRPLPVHGMNNSAWDVWGNEIDARTNT